ncbi:tRNA (cytidine(34)-2'-O)-methyltransferase [Devosia ginsengisoli]|uniref:tRNA (cytidine(34)-2'-O)-methyltransferase n=1 Tax=Devosia ginsengisoli TaxID=400770 RepID=UPI0026EEFE8C|nr:tRNA (cytidine(34)-2'-O)-methyltransferase [Devosia ginsengisoli]MCR6672397.1 tRNA (cytidine(34)-2'-O)-methyltransferase [Devosia ginsengisoli]
MPVDLALYQPDIANNTGTLIRLGACLGTTIHLIHPTGFPFSPKALARAGLDYVDHASVHEHVSWTAFNAWQQEQGRRLVLLTTRAETSAYAVEYRDEDILMVGRESAGVPGTVAEACDVRVRIPMREGMRSINVALAATLVLGEAKRQTGGFAGLR